MLLSMSALSRPRYRNLAGETVVILRAGARPSPARHDSGCSRECSPRATAGPRSMEPLTFGFVVQGRHCQALQAVAQVLGEPRFTLGRPGGLVAGFCTPKPE